MFKNITALALGGIAALALTTHAADASAQLRVGPQAGMNLDSDFALVGVDAWLGLTNVADGVQLHFSPGVAYYLDDFESATLMAMNLDLNFLYELSDMVRPYGILGLGINYVSVEILGERQSDTDMGLNLGAGALFLSEGEVQPFAELRIGLHDDTFAEVVAGALWRF